MDGTILLVGSDEEYTGILAEEIRKSGYEVDYFNNSANAIVKSSQSLYEIVVADYDLENINGMQMITLIKGMNPNIGGILISKEHEVELELCTLEQGIEHYVSKSKGIPVIIKYVDHLMKVVSSNHIIKNRKLYSKAENIELSLTSHLVYKDGMPVPLTAKEYALLVNFLCNKNVTLSREEIISKIWDIESERVSVRSIDGHIKRLRIKLNLMAISSIRGVGYRWEER